MINRKSFLKPGRLAWLAGLAVAAAGLTFLAVPAAPSAWAQRENATAANKQPPSVEVTKPQRGTVSHKVQFPAFVEAFEQADLYAKTSGYLSEVRADIGDRIKAGQILAVIDVPEQVNDLTEAKAMLVAKQQLLKAAEATVDQSKRALETAQRQLERYRAQTTLEESTLKRQEELFANKAATNQQLDEFRAKAAVARADVGVAEAKIEAAKADVRGAEAAKGVATAQVDVAAAQVEKITTLLGYSRIAAPFDGVVTRRLANRGDLAQAAMASRTSPLFTVQRIDIVRVVCEVPEAEAARVRVDDLAHVRLIGAEGKTIDATVTRLASALNPTSRTMRTEIHLANTDGRYLPGIYTQVALELGRRENAITVPSTAVGSDAKGTFVYTIVGGKVMRTAVKIGLNEGGVAEVTEGLAEDAQVVITAKGAPQPGTAIAAAPTSAKQ
jgi:RND family efflux transporter MFP subunit